LLEREGEGAFDPVINRTPAQAAAARLMPKPLNLKIYVAALTRDEMDETIAIVMEWGPFIPMDIEREDWIKAMIKDHKLAKHTANTILLYPSLESHCPRCTEIHDPQHRIFFKETCIVLSGREPQDMGGSFRASTYIAQRNQCTQGDISRESTYVVFTACIGAKQRWTTSVLT
jgi:hypothetical protein